MTIEDTVSVLSDIAGTFTFISLYENGHSGGLFGSLESLLTDWSIVKVIDLGINGPNGADMNLNAGELILIVLGALNIYLYYRKPSMTTLIGAAFGVFFLGDAILRFTTGQDI